MARTHARGRRSSRRIRAAVLALALAGAACGGDDGSSSSAADTTPDETAPGLVTVSLGDSYSSGAGAPPYDKASGPCVLSQLAWVHQLDAASPDIGSVEQRACAGAQSSHLTGPWRDRGLPAQIPATPAPDVTLVTVTIGGNDMGFGTMVWACTVGDCPPATAFAEPLRTLRTNLRTSTYPALRGAYPDARLVHVGYPRLTPPVGEDVVGCPWLSRADQKAAADTLRALNKSIEDSTRGTGVTYVDVSDVLAGHEMCTAEPWMRNIGEENAVHPTAEGQAAISRAVARALGLEVTD